MFQLPGRPGPFEPENEEYVFEEFTPQEDLFYPEDPEPDPTPEVVAEAIDCLEALAKILDDDGSLHQFAESNADTLSRAEVNMALQE